MSEVTAGFAGSEEPRQTEERSVVAGARWALSLGVLAIFLSVAGSDGISLEPIGTTLAWAILVAAADYHAVALKEWAQFSISLPLLLAAAMSLDPAVAGLVAIAGYVDRREFRGQVGFSRAVFNRAQVALSVMAAAAAFRFLGVDITDWPLAVGAGVAVLAVDFAVNFACVAGINTLRFRTPLGQSARSMFPEPGMRDFVLTYACLGATGVVIATLYATIGIWGVVASFLPLFFVAKMLERDERLREAHAHLRRKDEGLVQATRSMELERRDERAVLAGSLHDDVLPPLFKVQLMADVVRRDLESGALLDLETDLPAMLDAAEATSSAIRDLIGGLRRSGLGPEGLLHALRVRVRDVESRCRARITLDVQTLSTDPVIELVHYQVIREALENAAKHGDPSLIVVNLKEDGDGILLLVADDGGGFAADAGRVEGHYGLALMADRVSAIGGNLVVTSSPGVGTRVLARTPKQLPSETGPQC